MKVLVTGSNGLVGSEACVYFGKLGWQVHGIDNNMRKKFLGEEADTRWNQERLVKEVRGFEHHEMDIRYGSNLGKFISRLQPNLLVHAAAQPAHEVAAKKPIEDFHVNALGTLNLLEACREESPDTVFVYLSSSKVYGDSVNSLNVVEQETRYDFTGGHRHHGIPETTSIDQSMHTLYGVSKLAGDLLVQEYGRYFGLRTCCLRPNCMTGPQHSAVPLHGFLNYIVRCNLLGKLYTINGHKGKQVRDNLHAVDVVRFIHAFFDNPRPGEVYNLGGGKDNACSVLEAIAMVEKLTGKPMLTAYKTPPRKGDHICYYTDLRKAMAHYPQWRVTKSLSAIIGELVTSMHHGKADKPPT